jgi:hypothetical protein
MTSVAARPPIASGAGIGPVTGFTNPRASLLPDSGATLGGLEGGLADLYALMAVLEEKQIRIGKLQIDGAKVGRDAAAEEQEKAMQRALHASKKGGIFDFIADDLGLAGAVGLVTFDYALVVADVAAHKLGVVRNVKVDVVDVGALATGRVDVLAGDLLLRKTDLAPDEARNVLEKFGIANAPGISDEDVKPIAKDLIRAHLLVESVAATILSCGTVGGVVLAVAAVALSAGGSKIAEAKSFDEIFGEGSSQWIGLGMEIYGALASSLSGFAPGTAVNTAAGARAAAGIINGSTSILRGTDEIVIASHQRESAAATIDAERAKQMLGRLERLIDLVLASIHEAHDTHQKAAEIVQGVIQTLDASNMTLTHAMKA